MTDEKDIFAALRHNKTLLIIIGICLVLIEIEIFAVAAVKSGRKSQLEVLDGSGVVIYETDGANLSRFDKYYFEQTFGPFEQYRTRLVSTDVPFPFRAWFAAAIGLPVGLVLLFVFVVKAYTALFYGEKKQRDVHPEPAGSESRLEKTLLYLSRLNIFTIGFLIVLLIFSYWVVPNLLVYLGRIGVETLSRYKWALVAAAGVFVALVVWVIYLRYLIAKKSIEQQAEVDKYRFQLEFDSRQRETGRIGYDDGDEVPCLAASWEACREDADSNSAVSENATRIQEHTNPHCLRK